jgi:hypothetical protein
MAILAGLDRTFTVRHSAGMNTAPALRVRDAILYRRRIPFRMQFHVAGTIIDASEQFLVRVRIDLADGRSAFGMAAEAPAPIWFDKVRPLATTAGDLLGSITRTLDSYQDQSGPRTAFALFAESYAGQLGWARNRGAPDTVGSLGPALVDRAILDGLCRATGMSFFQAIQANLPGMTTELCPDLAQFDLPAFLAGLVPKTRMALRHTIGGHDPLTGAEDFVPIGDGLPETLEEVIATYGLRYFKIKIGPQIEATLSRLTAIASVLDRLDRYWVTLDGNEAFRTTAELAALLAAIDAEPALGRLRQGLLYIEQPIGGAHWRDHPVDIIDAPLIIDETDGNLDDFPLARRLGYRGTSAKTCKGVYKALLNAARCAQAGDGSFMASEDMNHPAGLGLQQDLALSALLGLEQTEKNGQHYMNGMKTAPEAEQQAFLTAHPDVYERSHGAVRLRLTEGNVSVGSLFCPGLGCAVEPDWTSLEPLKQFG